jgi:ankyrin repeat protein
MPKINLLSLVKEINFAIIRNNLQKVEELVNKDTKVLLTQVKRGPTPLGCALQEKNKLISQFLIKISDINLPSHSPKGILYPPLSLALIWGDLEIIEQIKNLNPVVYDPSIKKADYLSPLEAAYKSKNKEILAYFIDNFQVDINQPMRVQPSLLFLAIRDGRTDLLELAKYLIDKGININQKEIFSDNTFKTPLSIAKSLFYDDVVQLLEAHNAE